MIVTFRVIFLTYFVVTLPDICFVSISVDGTYWSAIVFNKDQLTQPACVQFMGENQQYIMRIKKYIIILSNTMDRDTFKFNEHFIDKSEEILKWKHPFSCIVAGPSGSEKTSFVLKLIKNADVLSKYARVVPLKDKSAQSVVVAMENILTDSNRTPNAIQGDKGKEFVNRKFNSMIKKYNIHFFLRKMMTLKLP